MLLALLLLAAADIDVTMSPLPEAFSPVRGAGLWTVYACADQDARISAARIEAAAAARRIRILPRPMAVAAIAQRSAERWQSRTARAVELVAAGATAFTAGGLIAASPRVVSAFALAVPVAGRTAGALRASLPSFDTAELLFGTVDIPAGGCHTSMVLAAKMRNASPIEFQIRSRVMLAPSISAIPKGETWKTN